MRFGVVEGDAVDGHVDAVQVGAPDPEVGVPDSGTGIRGGHKRGRKCQQVGDVLPKVPLPDLFSRNVDIGHGGLVAGQRGRYHHLARVDNGRGKHNLNVARLGQFDLLSGGFETDKADCQPVFSRLQVLEFESPVTSRRYPRIGIPDHNARPGQGFAFLVLHSSPEGYLRPGNNKQQLHHKQ